MTTKDTNGARRRRPLVFVHGTNSSSHLCSALITELTLQGHRCVAADLPGHGAEGFFPRSYQAPQDLKGLATEPSPLAKINIDDYVARVVDVVRRSRRHGPVILAGASQGGVTIAESATPSPSCSIGSSTWRRTAASTSRTWPRILPRQRTATACSPW